MQYTNLGNSGLIVSRFAFGAMTFGQGPLVGSWKTAIGQDVANIMIRKALNAGVNFFDTADMYTSGQSEKILGLALKDQRKDVVIATKCGFRSGETITSSGLSYRYILEAVENSLRRLQTDYIDLFLLHIPDPFTPLEETARALDQVIHQGKVRYVGYCNYPAWQAQKLIDIQKQLGLHHCITAQMYYSLLGRDLEQEYTAFLKDNNLGLMIWSPLASGFLTGKYTRENPVPVDSRRALFDFPPVNIDQGYEVVRILKDIAQRLGATPAGVALAWLLTKPFVSTVLIGASRPEQLDENFKAFQISLSEADVKDLDAVSLRPLPYPAWMQEMGRDQKVAASLALL